MVLTAIPTAIYGRLGVFAGVHCRTDSLRVRISGHRPTAADASPVTYKQGVSSSSLLAPTIIISGQADEIDVLGSNSTSRLPITGDQRSLEHHPAFGTLAYGPPPPPP